jgi:glutathione peroxidase
MNPLHTLTFNDTLGKEISIGDYKGKALLIVNTATRCGLAGQFEQLEALHQEFKDQGLVVIGFPCDQFMGQEPESNEDMVGVCLKNFGVTFTLSEKIQVNGAHTHPIFKYLKAQTKSSLGSAIKWNFTKFLVSGDGSIVKRFAPTTEPPAMREEIVSLLE